MSRSRDLRDLELHIVMRVFPQNLFKASFLVKRCNWFRTWAGTCIAVNFEHFNLINMILTSFVDLSMKYKRDITYYIYLS